MNPSPEPEPSRPAVAPRPPETVREYFAAELVRLRRAAHLSQAQLAERICYSPGLVGMVETCQRMPSQDFTSRCDTTLNAGGALTRLWPMLSKEVHPTWFRSFVALEAEALAVYEFELQAIPGVLQIEEYARANLGTSWPPRTSGELEQLLALRLERQEIIDRDNPPMLWFVLDESILYRPVGTDATMASQLQHLLEVGTLPFVRLQILPMVRSGRAPVDAAFFVLSLPRGERLVYVEGPASGQIISDPAAVERCALAFDAIRAQALSAEESADLITRTMGERYGNP